MFRRILNLFRQDLTNALRDNILLYMIVAPLLLALGARLFLPSLDQITATYAVQDSLDPALIDGLRQYGAVEVYPSRAAVEERVRRVDDVTGILPGVGGFELILEGNEAEDSAATVQVLESLRGRSPLASYEWQREREGRSLVTEYGLMSLLMISILLGALVMAFIIIEDKETRAIRALGVSPLSMLELTLARGLFAIVLGYVLVIASTLIVLGPGVNYGLLMVGFLASLGLPVLIGYLVGGLADSQLKAIALLKFVMVFYLTLPMVTAFLPRSMHIYFYILPNYWMWTIFENVIIGQLGPVGLWGAAAITMAMSLPLVAIAMPILRRQLKLR
jgi:ABC-2 type transport system permease protein